MASAGWNPAPLNTSPSVPSAGSHTVAAIQALPSRLRPSRSRRPKADSSASRRRSEASTGSAKPRRRRSEMAASSAASIATPCLASSIMRLPVAHAAARRQHWLKRAKIGICRNRQRGAGVGMLTAHMLGGFSLRDDKGRDVPLRSRKARALMGYLLVSGGVAERREKLASLLWSESTTEQAFDSLRHCISELRRAERSGGFPFLEADRDTIRIDRRKVRTDLEEL